MRFPNIKASTTLSNDIVHAALAWHRTPNGTTKRALRAAVDALVSERSHKVAVYLANEQCALETSTPIVRSVGFSGEISTKCFAVYSDGSTIRNPGPSGCGWVVMNEGEVVHEGFKAIGYATNQIAEIRAAAYGLNDLPEGATVEVFTDSLYVVKTMRGQYRKKTNLEHWQCLADAVGRHASVTFHHVRGHAGHQVNERADRLARKASSEAEQDARDAMS